LHRILQFSLSTSVRSQDVRFVLYSAAGSREGGEMAWAFFKARSEEIRSRYKQGQLLNNVVKACTSSMVSLREADEVEAFFKENSLGGTERTVAQVLEKIRLRANWGERDGGGVKDFLKAK